MKDNPLMKNSEQLAVEIEKLCKSLEKKAIQILFFKSANHHQVFLQIFQKLNILKVCRICFQNSKLPEKSVLKQKVG